MKDIIIPINVPSDVMIALNKSEKELQSDIQKAIAVLLFQEGKLTLGKAVQLSGLSYFQFEGELAKRKIPLSDIDLGQINADVEKLT